MWLAWQDSALEQASGRSERTSATYQKHRAMKYLVLVLGEMPSKNDPLFSQK